MLVVERRAALQRQLPRGIHPRAVLRMHAREIGVMAAGCAWGQAENTAGLGRQAHAVARDVVHPTADVGNCLGTVQVALEQLHLVDAVLVGAYKIEDQDNRKKVDGSLDSPADCQRSRERLWQKTPGLGQREREGRGSREQSRREGGACADEPAEQQHDLRVDDAGRTVQAAGENRRAGHGGPRPCGEHINGGRYPAARKQKPCGQGHQRRRHGTQSTHGLIRHENEYDGQDGNGTEQKRCDAVLEKRQRRFPEHRAIHVVPGMRAPLFHERSCLNSARTGPLAPDWLLRRAGIKRQQVCIGVSRGWEPKRVNFFFL